MTDLEQKAREAAEARAKEMVCTGFNAGFVATHRRGYVEDHLAAAKEAEQEIAALRARVAELEGIVPKWLYMRAGQPSPEYVRLLSLGWTDAISSFPNDYPKNPMCWQLMVPPIPLPEGTAA